MEYMVRRTTYDKLERFCNSLGNEGWDITVHHVGSRDWVMFCKREAKRAMTRGDIKDMRSRGFLVGDERPA